MKTLALLASIIFLGGIASATTVTGQVKDPTGLLYRSCQGSASFAGQNATPGAGPYLLGGASTFQTVVPIFCDSFARFTVSMADNSLVTPTPSQWRFSLCSATGAYPGPPICFNALITITGASQDVSAALQAAAAPLPPYTVTLETNGVLNGSQSLLNLKNGSNVTIVDDGFGGVTIGSSGGGGGGGGGLPDPGNNGLVGRIALNTTTAVQNVAAGATLVSQGTGTLPTYQTKPIYDTRDWMTCDGSTDATTGMNTLLATIGSKEAAIRFIGSTNPTDSCRIGNTFLGTNITADYSGGGSVKLISSVTPPGGAGFVNGTSVECGAGATCSAPPLSTSAGNIIVVTDAPYPGFTFKITSVTDDCGDFYIHVQQSLVGQARNQGAWVASSIRGGTCTVTVTANGALTTNMMIVSQWSGMGPVASLDGTGADNRGTGTTMSTGATVTTTAGSLLIGYGGQPFTAETCAAAGGYTQPVGIVGQTSPNGFLCLEYLLSSVGGATSATQTISANPSPGTWVYSLLALKPGSATLTILGGVINPDLHQIFFNADGAAGHGVVDFTGGSAQQVIYPEWWGGSPIATATANTSAIQAAVYAAFGCGPNFCRTNASGAFIYNRELHFSPGIYPINDEILWYHVNGFVVTGSGRLNSGIQQTVANKRIVAGDSISYGVFRDLTFSSSVSQDATHPLVDLDFTGTQGTDLHPQFIDFEHVGFNGNTLAAVGLQIAKSGGTAQGSNINCWDCNFLSFSTAAARIGTPNFYATNGLDNSFIQGDIQGSPLYGIAVYGGNVNVRDMTMENGFASQTGFDIYCEATQFTCDVQNVRSESRRLVAGTHLAVRNSKTLNQATFPTPGTTLPVFPAVSSIMMGSSVGGDGKYYKVTVNAGAFGGAGTPSAQQFASGGSPTTVANTNSSIVGSVTVGVLFTIGETVTQAVTGATATAVSRTAPLWVSGVVGAPDNSHTWTGGTSATVLTPTALPVATSYTVNAFTGFRASILGGTNIGCYGVVSSNTATVVTVASWITLYKDVPCPGPDSTSSFVVEPNWGTQFTSGGMTWADLNENGIEGSLGAGLPDGTFETVDVPGDRIGIAATTITLRNVTVTRNDWANMLSGNAFNSGAQNFADWDVYNRISIAQGGNARYQNGTIPRLATGGTPTIYSGPLARYLGTRPLIWSCGEGTSAIACNDVWIGGRSNPLAAHDTTKTILEFGGMLGRAVPFGTDIAGTDTDITGGPSTGTGLGGAVNFYTSNPGGSSATVNAGLKRWLISTGGHWLTGLDNSYDIGANAATRPRSIYSGTSIVNGDPSFGSSQTNTRAACETSFAATTLNVGGTTTDTGLTCLPAIAIIDAVVYRITTTITTAANFTIGDATTAARFCAAQAVLTAGTTGTCFMQADQTGAPGPRQVAAAAVRVTTNANPGAGAIRLIVYYHTWTPPTS